MNNPALFLKGRDLRKRPALRPGGAEVESIVTAFVPLVYGTAQALLPNPGAAASVTRAVFETFGYRWKKISRGTFLAQWFIHTTLLAIWRQIRLDNSPVPKVLRKLKNTFLNFPAKVQMALVFLDALKVSLNDTGTVLSIALGRLQRKLTKAHRVITKILSKNGRVETAEQLLARWNGNPDETLSAEITERLVYWTNKEPGNALISATITAWRWRNFQLFMRNVGRSIGTTFAVLGCALGIFIFLATHGYLNGFFMRQQAREMAKNHPQLLEPAKPWPVSAEDYALARTVTPATPEELYTTHAIYPVKLTFTREQWDGITPSNIGRGDFRGENGMNLRNPNAKRSGLSGMVGIEFNWTTGAIQFASTSISNVAVRYRGNGTYLNSSYGTKQSLKVDLNRFEKGQEIAGVNELNFLNSIADFSYVRDTLSEEFFRDLGVPGPRTAYAYLTLNVPGKFNNQPMGLFVMMEAPNKDFAKDRWGTKKVPIFKPVTTALFSDLGTKWDAYAPIYDLKTEASPEQLQLIIDLAKLTTHASDEEFAQRLPDFVDLENFAAFVAGHVLLSSYDGFLENGQNFYMFLHPKTSKLGFISWDQDHSWGEFGYVGTAETREYASIWEPASYPFHFLKRVFKVEAFRKIYRTTIEDAMKNLFTVERLYPRIDQLAEAIRPAVKAENPFRYKKFEESISDKWIPRQNNRRGGAPEGPDAPTHQIKLFITNRIEAVKEQLEGKSKGVTLSRRR